jgi:amino acid transporter
MILLLKRILIGNALKNDELKDEKFNVFWGLPILSSDAISSVAYAGEEILWILFPILGLMAYKYMFYAALAIAALLLILVFSYKQTIDCYPNGGGAYIVATDNLGTIPGLIAGASLSIDYILTVAVSASAGTAAITSAVPSLLPHKVSITLVLILIMTIGNLRGIRESSRIFGVPTYLFIFSILALIITGIYKVYFLGYTPQSVSSETFKATGDITLFLFIRAFASGCTALTGVEAVSNGIPNFKEPSQKNAKIVLELLALFVLLIFGGTSFLATKFHAVPNYDKTVISQIASQVFGNTSFMFYMVQITTAIILAMAANTAFSGFPLLLSLIARDGYVPRQFAKRGERLSFSNGIIILAIAASILIVIFKGETHLLMPLYAVGVFISFTLSQTGMLVKWTRERSGNWKHKAFINGLGALITFTIAIIIGITKFQHGAWIVCILIPIFVFCMMKTKSHYVKVAKQLSLSKDEIENEMNAVKPSEYIIVLIDSLNKASFKAINYARRISNNSNLVAFHASIDDKAAEKLKAKWKECGLDIPLIIKPAPYRNIMDPLMEFIESEEHASMKGDMVTIVMPQFVVCHWWDNIFHNQTAFFIKQKLMHDRHIAIITVPYVLD